MAKFEHAQNKPFTLTMKPGRYSWCSCGASKKQPFCDGNHEETGMRPIVVTIKEETEVHWCGCKCSENQPYCDGSHKKYE
ncbi:MAG: CDGSH-type Zn-finger protein [Lysobacterales bacterium]|jgi:CDGSH-type Zn-finger protein